MNKKSMKIELREFDELFGIKGGGMNVIEIPLDDLHPFRRHPFRVIEDKEMLDLIESVREQGVLVPAVVRPREEGGYEIIAGHRRKYAAEKTGLTTMPAVVREYDDDQATIVMVDSNYQRSNLLISEKAKSFSMKYDALKHQGKKAGFGNTADWLAKAEGRSGRTIQRYIRLTRLLPEFLEMIDRHQIGVIQGGFLASLGPGQQQMVYEVVKEYGRPLTNDQAVKIGSCSPLILDKAKVEEIMNSDPERPKRIILNTDTVKGILGDRLPQSDTFYHKRMTEKIYDILREWVETQNTEGKGT